MAKEIRINYTQDQNNAVKKGINIIFKALNKAVEHTLVLLGGDLTNINEALIYFNSEVVKDAYLSLYVTIGSEYGMNVYRKAKTFKKAINTEDPDWLLFFNEYVNTKCANSIVNVTENTKQSIRNIVKKTLQLGLSNQEAAKLIREEMVTINKRRAITIARTEVVTATNVGSLEGAKQSGVKMVKSWISISNKRTRDNHAGAAANVLNKNIPLDAKFTVGGEKLDHPGDPSASGKNRINCRCSQVFKPIENV